MGRLSAAEALLALNAHSDEPLAVLRALGGFYECPRDATGARTGPLVGYAGTYKVPGGEPLHYVGEVYADFAAVERYPGVLLRWTNDLARRLPTCNVVCGAPLGGMSIAQFLALGAGKQYVFPEKVVTEAKTADRRENSSLVWGRHTVEPGQKVLIVEDVANNFTTTDELIRLILSRGAEVAGLVCLLNRSLTVDQLYESGELKVPIISLARKPIAQYRQDDPAVAADVAAGNVVWKPKTEWAKLEAAMAAVAQT